MSILWPRLDRTVAEPLFRDLEAGGTRPNAGELRHDAQTFASAGGTRATPQDLRQLREAIVEVARNHGFNENDRTDLICFDRAMAAALLPVMPMTTTEALTRSVWTFVALVVAPDVTHWRFIDPNRTWNPERWICTDRTRHMFGRLWWQARQLATPTPDGLDTSLLDGLSESELNHLTERTSIGGCRPLVQSIARAVVELPPEARQRGTVRNAALRLLRLTAVVDPYSLDEEQLNRLTARAVAEAADAAL